MNYLFKWRVVIGGEYGYPRNHSAMRKSAMSTFEMKSHLERQLNLETYTQPLQVNDPLIFTTRTLEGKSDLMRPRTSLDVVRIRHS